jgi:hypothetical protein
MSVLSQAASAFNPLDYAISGGAPAGGMTTGVSGGNSTSSGSSQSSTQMIPGMMGVYSQLLGLNQQNYGNVLGAYNTGQQNISSTMPGITSGYGNLNAGIQNTLGMGQVLGQNGNWGVAQPAATAIGQAYQQQLANNTQQQINAGLGNTTVGANLANQATLGAAQAYGGLGAQLAQTAAGYQAQIGQAGLASQMQGLGMQTGLSQAEGGALAGYQYQNTAGALAGPVSSSQQSSSSQQASQQQQPQPQQGQQSGNSGASGASPYSAGGGGGGLAGMSGTGGGGGGIGAYQQNSPGFQSGSAAMQGAANYPTTGISGSVGVTGQAGIQPGQSSGSINPETGNSMGFSTNPYGPPITSGFSAPGATAGGGAYGGPQNAQEQAFGQAMIASGMSQDDMQSTMQAAQGATPDQINFMQDAFQNPQNAPEKGYTVDKGNGSGAQWNGSSWVSVKL